MYLPEQIKDIFDERKLTLSVAESASGGHMAAIVTSQRGSSTFFRGGVVAYTIDVKGDLLEVDREHAASVNCVSERVAREMASGARRLFNTSVGVSITGYAEPSPANGVETPFVWVGFDVKGKVWAERVELEPSPWLDEATARTEAQENFASSALEGLVAYLLSIKP